MATFAMMGGNVVSNIIVADDKEATEAALGCTLIEYTAENPAGIGWSYDENTGQFLAPQGPVGLTDLPSTDMSNGAVGPQE